MRLVFYRKCTVSFIFVCLFLSVLSYSPNNIAIEKPSKYALIFYDYITPSSRQMLLSNEGIEILDDYGTFTYVRIDDGQILNLRNRNIIVQTLPNIGKIKFQTITFDTSMDEPNIPDAYRANEPVSKEYGYYIVQMEGPPKENWIRQIENTGANILDITNYYAYIVKMTPEIRDIISCQPFISWTGLYHPFYKLRGDAEKLTGNVDLTVIFFKNAGINPQLQQLRNIGGDISYSSDWNRWWNYVRVHIDSSRLPEIVAIPDVWFVEPYRPISFETTPIGPNTLSDIKNGILNDKARWIIQSGISGSCPVWDNGLHGENIVIGTCDSGVDYDHINFRDTTTDQGIPGPSHRKIVRYWDYDDDWDENGHGSHTAGTICGDNITSPNLYDKYDGMAYCAKLSVFDQTPGWLRPDFGIVLQDSANWSANSHSNSWKVNSDIYDEISQSVDQFMWDNPNFQVFKSCGNDGPGNHTITTPGTAKNIVSVGSCYNDGSENLVDYSSRGPTSDGVRKPDIVAPGLNIISVDSDRAKSTYNSGYVSMEGTSMACPMAAGGCALVEQYFRDGFYPSGENSPGNGFMPSAPLKKAILLNSGKDISGADARIPDNSQGWGRLTLDYALYFKGDSRKLWVYDDYSSGSGLTTGQKWSRDIQVNSTDELKVSLVWNDYPGAGLKNDLNLVVRDPNGDIYVGSNFNAGVSVKGSAAPDSANPVESIYIKSPIKGTYNIEITATTVISVTPQKFAVVATGAIDFSYYGIKLISPKTGSNIIGGSTNNISWATTGGASPISVEILYSNNSGSSYASIASSQPATGMWAWGVPAINTNKARIKVVATDKNSNITQSESGDFTIRLQTVLNLHAPNGGEIIPGGRFFQIKWNTSGGSGLTIDVFYSNDSGSNFILVQAGIPDSGQYSWMTPVVDTKTARIKVSAVNSIGDRINATSATDFNIVSTGPSVLITTPSSGVLWKEGLHQIAWTIIDTIGLSADSINISYSTDDGTTWVVLANSQAETMTSYDWHINADSINTDMARVQVSVYDIIGRESKGDSAKFTIDTSKPIITHNPVTTVALNAVIPISTTVSDTVGNLVLTLSYTNVGNSSFTDIAMSKSSGTYTGDIPAQSTLGTLKYHIIATDLVGHWTIEPAIDQVPSGDKNHTIEIINVTQTGSISGTVKNSTGITIVEAIVFAYLSGSIIKSNTTDVNGMYRIALLNPDTYNLVANASGYIDSQKKGVIVSAGNDSPGNDITLMPWKPPTPQNNKRQVSGQILDAIKNTGIKSALVSLSCSGIVLRNISTSDDGSFQFLDLDPKIYIIQANKSGYADKSTQVSLETGNASDVILRLEPKSIAPPPESTPSSSQLPVGMIAAIVCAVVISILLIALFLIRQKKKSEPQLNIPPTNQVWHPPYGYQSYNPPAGPHSNQQQPSPYPTQEPAPDTQTHPYYQYPSQ